MTSKIGDRTRRRFAQKTSHTYKARRPKTNQSGGGKDCDDLALSIESFDHPSYVKAYLDKNFYKFIWGLGVILKFKSEEMTGKVKRIEAEINNLNIEYRKNEDNYATLIEKTQNSSSSEMKEKLQESVREQLNTAYETKVSEKLIKKQAYDVVLKGIENRRWFLVKALQERAAKEDGSPGDLGQEIKDKINYVANEIYKLYRGTKYVEIRKNLYSQIKTIAENPTLFRGSFVLNSSIVGPAGSGKTTMARQISSWYAALGVLTYDAFYEDKEFKMSLDEVSRANLIGEYMGQTAPKTLGVLAKSLEKTLFIDEAYSVTGCSFDGEGKVQADSYGEEFLATLLLFMNDHKGYSAVIVAGYETQMKKCFFDRNEGLPRRFPNQIVLPFYTTDELFGIFMKNVTDKLLTTLREQEKKKKKAANNADPGHVALAGASGSVGTDPGGSPSSPSAATAAVGKPEKAMLPSEIEYIRLFNYLTVMKPSFLMIHMDTSFDAIQLLRRYLLSIQYRILLTSANNNTSSTMDQLKNGSPAGSSVGSSSASAPPQANPQTTVDLTNVYSYTILAHVLMNLFEPDTKSARKQLMRRMFYRDVYSFEKTNLSYFQAQAGEMENLADRFIIQDGAKVMESKEISACGYCTEQAVLNSFLESKNLRLDLFEQIEPASVRASVGAPHTRNGTIPNARSGSSGAASSQASTNARSRSSGAAPSPQARPQASPSPSPALSPNLSPALSPAPLQLVEKPGWYLELSYRSSPMKVLQERIADFFDFKSLFANGIPSLLELFSLFKINENMDRITHHMVTLYLNKQTGNYLNGLSDLQDNEFPIHIPRSQLDREIEELTSINMYKVFKKEFDRNVSTVDKIELTELEKLLRNVREDPTFAQKYNKVAQI